MGKKDLLKNKFLNELKERKERTRKYYNYEQILKLMEKKLNKGKDKLKIKDGKIRKRDREKLRDQGFELNFEKKCLGVTKWIISWSDRR